MRCLLIASASLVKLGVKGVEVFSIQAVGGNAESITESLIVNDLAFAQVLDGVAYVGVVYQAENVVVGDARLLLGGKILVQIGKQGTPAADAG